MNDIILFRKKDIIILATVIILSVAFFVTDFMLLADDNVLMITSYDGSKEYISLSEDDEYKVETEYGVNIICIKDGKAYVSTADCKNQICVNTAPISKTGETICCLPHKLAITIVPKAQAENE